MKRGGNRMSIMAIVVVAVVAVAAYFIWAQMQGSGGSSGATGQKVAVQTIGPKQYQSEFVTASQPHLLVDVRTPEEFAGGHIAGAVNIPLQSLAQRMDEIPQDEPAVLYCRSGNRSATAGKMLAQAGYTDVYDLGGIIAWQSQGLALTTQP